MDKNSFDLITFGEIMLRLSPPRHARIVDGDIFEKRAGGAELNVASGVALLGLRTGIVSKLPQNELGTFIKNRIRFVGVSDDYLVYDDTPDARLGLYYYEMGAAPRKPTIVYDRHQASVTRIKMSEIPDDIYHSTRMFHTSGISLALCQNMQNVAVELLRRFKAAGATISFDVNYRANLWKSKEEAIVQMKAPLPLVDILKVSDEELPLLTGTADCESGTAQLAQNGIRLIFVTLGADGVFYRFGDKTGHVAGVPCKVGDTNGAGDTFFGAALSKLCKEDLTTLTVDKLETILTFANKAASITTSRHGAIPAMPTLADVEG